MKMHKSMLPLFLLIFCLATPGFAQVESTEGQEKQEPKEAHHGKSADEVAKELANPNSSLASLTFKNQFRWYTGDLPDADDQNNYTLLFQPVFPFPLETKANGDKPALGDIGFDLSYAVTKKNGLLWAAGMVGTLPAATDSDVAGKQLRLGPEILIAKVEKWGLYGIFPNHQWDVTGWGEDKPFSTTQIEPVFKLTPGGGWTVGTLPIMSYDWENEEWTVPINLTVSKTIIFGKTPWKFELDANYYVEQPDAFGPEWMIGFNITPVVPNFINNWIRGL